MTIDTNRQADIENKAPVFGAWGGWYALVAALLGIVILLLYLLQVAFG